MVRFAQGDDSAFELLVERHEKEMMNFFYRLTGEPYLAEDLTQDLFLKVFRYRKSYRPQSTFRYFLFQIARNMWIDLYRKRKVRPRELSLEAPTQRNGSSVDFDAAHPDCKPQDGLIRNEQIEALNRAVAQLPEKQREVVALSFEGKLKYAEIAEILGVPEGTIKSRMHAAVKNLRDLMGGVA
ncbi:MAG: sigma-70 family RNA polymerase sigma factor [Planctomycetota bacterium]